MSVDIEHQGTGVAQPGCHHCRVDAWLDQQGDMGVAEIMEPHSLTRRFERRGFPDAPPEVDGPQNPEPGRR